MSMMNHVERYVALKRHLGFKFDRQKHILQAYARHADFHGDELIHSSRMIETATSAPSAQTARQKLAILRNFALWLRSEDVRHEVPPRDALGRQKIRRRAPHLMTREQIRTVMEAALGCRPAGSITPQTLYYMIGLAAATGMRACEVVALRVTDLTPDGILVRRTKFRKARMVPLHATVRKALQRYLDLRAQCGALSDRLFVLSNGNPARSVYFSQKFTELAIEAGIKKGPREGPSLHSLRHTFAARSLEAADSRDRAVVGRHIMALTTYLGHVHMASTYWYLEATPDLLQSISLAAEGAYAKEVSQ